MKNFVNLSEQKVTTMMRLINNKDLVKAVHYGTENFLDQPDLLDPASLLYSQIFPYRFVPDIQDPAKTYITLSFRGYKPVNGYYKSGLIYFNVLTHVDLVKTDYEALRYDFIIQKIDEAMNDKAGLALGNSTFYEMDEWYVNEKYLGVYVAYKIYDFS